MKLKAIDRVVLNGMMPNECGLEKARTVRKIREALEFTEAETEAWKPELIDTGNGSMAFRCDPHEPSEDDKPGKSIDTTTDIELSAEAFKLILGIFEKLDKDEKLSPTQHLHIYEQFLDVITNK